MTNARIAYRQADAAGSNAVRLVVMLYEQMIQDLSKAAEAVEQNDVELRTKYINHAILVIGYLQSPLDFANGGKVAKDLDNFYNVLRKNLVQAQFFPSKPVIAQLITDVLALREAWIHVEQAEKSFVPPARSVTNAGTQASAPANPDPESTRSHWQG